MKISILIKIFIPIIILFIFGCGNYTSKQKKYNQKDSSQVADGKTIEVSKLNENFKLTGGNFYLNYYSKNNAGWFHLDVLNSDNNTYYPAAPTDVTGYFAIPPGIAPGYNRYLLKLPDNQFSELTPTMTTWRAPDTNHTPARGHWQVDFDISCIGEDLVERKVTPRYTIMARGFLDCLRKDDVIGQDGRTNDGFKIYLIKDFSNADIITMLAKNTETYNEFKVKTGRL